MTDRNVQYPSRYKLTLVEGTSDVYELTPAPGEVSAEGTILNKANLLSDNTAQALGLPQADPTVNDALNQLSGKQDPWQLIDLLDNTGEMAGTWTAPDVFEGENYDLGVYMIGGGASGGAKTYNSGEIYVTGGASGYGKNFIINNVAPNTQYSYVVGAKGEGVTASRNTTGTDGNSGGTTSFNLVEAEGGQGGFGYSRGASGGQASDVCNGVVDLPYTPRRLFGCVASFDGGGATQPVRDGQNMFDENMITLCAGGWAFNSSTARLQEIVAMPDGTKGGDGSSSATGNNATGYGNGGGGVARWSSSGTATSGSGSDGAIYLYARRRSPVEYRVSITVLDQDDNPVDGIAINGLYSNAEGSRNGLAVTGSNGVATGISYQQQATFTTDAYTDLTSGSVSLVMTEGSVTEGTINVTFTNFVQWTASGTARFSHYVKRVDVSAVGGGGGGSGGTGTGGVASGFTPFSGQGGAGGYASTQDDVDFAADTDLTVAVGAGGRSGSGGDGGGGGDGGTSTFLGVSAAGGAGGLLWSASGHNSNNTEGNGYGGAGNSGLIAADGVAGGPGSQTYYSSLTQTAAAGGGGGGGAIIWNGGATMAGGSAGSPNGGAGGSIGEELDDEDTYRISAESGKSGARPGGGGGGGSSGRSRDGYSGSGNGGRGGSGIITCRIYNTHTIPTA